MDVQASQVMDVQAREVMDVQASQVMDVQASQVMDVEASEQDALTEGIAEPADGRDQRLGTAVNRRGFILLG